MTKVKICGITNLQDGLSALSLGADALGFNFYEKSPRYIRPDDASRIIKHLGGAELIKVGVFVNDEIENIARIASTSGLDAIQLHGDESPEFVRKLKKLTGLEIIKAFRVSAGFDPRDVLKYDADAILLDAYSKAEYGGTGETFNWEIARQVRELVPKLYLAGGLSPANVANAIIQVKPYAVDACSSLESRRGKKDVSAVTAFISNTNKNSEELVEFVNDRLKFLVDRYGFTIERIESSPGFVWIEYESARVAIAAYDQPARMEHGLCFSLIAKDSHQFSVLDLISAERLEVTLVADDHFGLISQTGSAKYIIGRSADILEQYGESVILGEPAAYQRLREDLDRRSVAYNLHVEFDQLRKKANAAWHQRDYPSVVENYGKMKTALLQSERKKLNYAEKKIHENE